MSCPRFREFRNDIRPPRTRSNQVYNWTSKRLHRAKRGGKHSVAPPQRRNTPSLGTCIYSNTAPNTATARAHASTAHLPLLAAITDAPPHTVHRYGLCRLTRRTPRTDILARQCGQTPSGVMIRLRATLCPARPALSVKAYQNAAISSVRLFTPSLEPHCIEDCRDRLHIDSHLYRGASASESVSGHLPRAHLTN